MLKKTPIILLLLITCELYTTAAKTQNIKEKQISELNNQDISIYKIKTFTKGGQSLDWSKNNEIIIGRKGINRYYNIDLFNKYGTRIQCLTLGLGKGSRIHCSNPNWHPNGKYYLFTAQNLKGGSYSKSMPENGLNSNIYLGTKDGKHYWKLTDITSTHSNQKGVVNPKFSPNGKKILWAGNTGKYPKNSICGERSLYIADFTLNNNKPSIYNIEKLKFNKPQNDYYTSHGFSPDGKKILFSANLNKNQPAYSMDLYSYDLKTKKLTNLTKNNKTWDDFACYSPDGKKIIWVVGTKPKNSYLGSDSTTWKTLFSSELWIMNADGSNKKRITSFNIPNGIGYMLRKSFVSNCTWSPNSNKIAICLNYSTKINTKSKVVILTLGKNKKIKNHR